MFEYLASVDYDGFEFFSFSNGANPALTTAQIRTALDNAGLKAAGTHTGGLAAMSDPVNGAANRQAQIDMAGILGYKMIGTAGNPANPTLGTLAAWQQYAEQANMVGAAFRAAGIKYFFHPEQDWFRFFADPAHPELDRVHRIDWFTDNTDPKLVYFEPDTMHTLAGRARFPDPVDGRLFDVNAWYGRLAADEPADRLARQGRRPDRPAAARPGTNPFTQTRARPGFPLNGGVDVVYVGEGSISRGYPVDPDPEVIGYQDQFDRFELSSPGWFHAESDSGPGPAATDPGRSLRWAKVSAAVSAQPARGRRARGLRGRRPRPRPSPRPLGASPLPLLVAAIIAIAATGSAWAHGDPASHYLETDPLYPSFARQPSVEVQLQLLGLLQATERRGYPIKVALVAGAEDLVDDLARMRTPQRYANTVASMIAHELEAPIARGDAFRHRRVRQRPPSRRPSTAYRPGCAQACRRTRGPAGPGGR